MGTKKTETLAIKIEPELKNRIAERANEENRNLSNFVVTVITNYLDEIDRAKRIIGK